MSKNLIFNKKIKKSSNGINDKIYCHESYTQELYNLLAQNIPLNVNKDLRDGDFAPVICFSPDVTNKIINVDLPGFVPAVVSSNSKKENEFFKYVELTTSSDGIFGRWKFTGSNTPLQPLEVVINSTEPYMIGSFYDAHIAALKKQLQSDLFDGTNWYTATILEKNKGGFMVNIGGLRAFLPGGLAAANKIVDFDSYIGKDVRVMVESYSRDTDTYIVSNKKYISYALPEILGSLDMEKLYTAVVTGIGTSVSKVDGRIPFGLFLEFEGILTGLLHVTEMTENTRDKLFMEQFHPGDVVQVWVREISKDNRIILTEFDSKYRSTEILELKKSLEGIILEGTVRVIKEYGALLDLGSGLTGLLPYHETKKLRLHPDLRVVVCVHEVNSFTGKILLSKPEPDSY